MPNKLSFQGISNFKKIGWKVHLLPVANVVCEFDIPLRGLIYKKNTRKSNTENQTYISLL